ncbi:unnamed protein product [Dimorphilus gyrociliatus]|uniref:Uncharacterized protein n=1 Tax=Dimorphilus gyrociliatus TaxID=2664684 RepID=A0A7I8W2X6_9ANNE|nr:unnamed protein product [Dimorphilus gyrociliatus]
MANRSLINGILAQFENEFKQLFEHDGENLQIFLKYLQSYGQIDQCSRESIDDEILKADEFEKISSEVFHNYFKTAKTHVITDILNKMSEKFQNLSQDIRTDWNKFINNSKQLHLSETHDKIPEFQILMDQSYNSDLENETKTILLKVLQEEHNKLVIDDKNNKGTIYSNWLIYLYASKKLVLKEDLLILRLSGDKVDFDISLEENLFKQNFPDTFQTPLTLNAFLYYMDKQNNSTMPLKVLIFVDETEELLNVKDSDIFRKVIIEDNYHFPFVIWIKCSFLAQEYELVDFQLKKKPKTVQRQCKDVTPSDLTDLEKNTSKFVGSALKGTSLVINPSNETDIKHIFQCIVDNRYSSITEFSLSKYNLTNEHIADAFGAAISKLVNLEILFINNNNIETEVATSLFTNIAQNCSKIKKLYFANINLDKKNTYIAGKAIGKQRELQMLSFSYNKIGSIGARPILQNIADNCWKLTVLIIQNTAIGKDIGNILGKAVGKQVNLEEFNMNSNKIGSKPAKTVFQNIERHCHKISKLYVANIGMDNEIGDSFGNAVGKLKNLKVLSCSYNSIGASVAKTLFQNIVDNNISQIEELYLPDSCCTNEVKDLLSKTKDIQKQLKILTIRREDNERSIDIADSIISKEAKKRRFSFSKMGDALKVNLYNMVFDIACSIFRESIYHIIYSIIV